MTATQIQKADPDKQRVSILATVERYGDEIASLAPRGVEPAHYMASLRLHLASNPKLLECMPASIAQGILRVAQTGLDLGVSCDLLPFGKQCQFNPRYNGIIELALAAGVRAINADVVREGDAFDYQKGTGFFLHHKHGKEKGPITHAYAIAELKVGSFVFDVLDREEIDEIREEFSRSWWKATEWVNNVKTQRQIDLDEIPWYAKKTVVRKLAPYLPKNARLAAALLYADAVEEAPEAEFRIEGQPEPTDESPATLQEVLGQDDTDIVRLDEAREKELLGASNK